MPMGERLYSLMMSAYTCVTNLSKKQSIPVGLGRWNNNECRKQRIEFTPPKHSLFLHSLLFTTSLAPLTNHLAVQSTGRSASLASSCQNRAHLCCKCAIQLASWPLSTSSKAAHCASKPSDHHRRKGGKAAAHPPAPRPLRPARRKSPPRNWANFQHHVPAPHST